MKYISTQPPRLYCGTCEEVYYVPQKGTVKVNIYCYKVTSDPSKIRKEKLSINYALLW